MNFNYLSIKESNDLSLAKQIETISLRHIETLENDLKEFNFIIDFLKQYETKKIDKRKVEKLNQLLDRPYHKTEYGNCLNSKGYFIRESGNMIYLTRLDYSNSKGKTGLTILIGYDKNKVINIKNILEYNPCYSKNLQSQISKLSVQVNYRKYRKLAKHFRELNNIMYEFNKLLVEYPDNILDEIGIKEFTNR
jgi:hypothetical protein|tara:strand:- start:177 stop:755 length:579 start_codon:yes stop_codon:yes gene_type:complete